jgi:hypothetical protein
MRRGYDIEEVGYMPVYEVGGMRGNIGMGYIPIGVRPG